jgi:WD40 repeat protein
MPAARCLSILLLLATFAHADDRPVSFWEQKEKEFVNAFAFSPDGRLLATGTGAGESGTVAVWELATFTRKHFQEGSGMVTALRFTPDGKALAAGSYARTITLFRVLD